MPMYSVISSGAIASAVMRGREGFGKGVAGGTLPPAIHGYRLPHVVQAAFFAKLPTGSVLGINGLMTCTAAR